MRCRAVFEPAQNMFNNIAATVGGHAAGSWLFADRVQLGVQVTFSLLYTTKKHPPSGKRFADRYALKLVASIITSFRSPPCSAGLRRCGQPQPSRSNAGVSQRREKLVIRWWSRQRNPLLVKKMISDTILRSLTRHNTVRHWKERFDPAYLT